MPPPDATFTGPPEIPVPEFGTPVTTPPDETFSMPPVRIPTLLVMVPATFSVPPLDTAMWAAVPPDETFNTAPPETPRKAALPPQRTFKPPTNPRPKPPNPQTT